MRFEVRNIVQGAQVDEYICDLRHEPRSISLPFKKLLIMRYTRDAALLRGAVDVRRPALKHISELELSAENRGHKFRELAQYLRDRRKAAVVLDEAHCKMVVLPPEDDEITQLRAVYYTAAPVAPASPPFAPGAPASPPFAPGAPASPPYAPPTSPSIGSKRPRPAEPPRSPQYQPPAPTSPQYQPPAPTSPQYQPPAPRSPAYQPPAPTSPSYAPPAPTSPSYAPPAPKSPEYAPPAPKSPEYAPPAPKSPEYAPPAPKSPEYAPPAPAPAAAPSPADAVLSNAGWARPAAAAPQPAAPRGLEGYEAVDAEGFVWRSGRHCAYFQDHRKRYRFDCGEKGLLLLERLVAVTSAAVALNDGQIAALGGGASDAVRREGESIYRDKAALQARGITWTHEEYGHLGLQKVYLETKCWQRFTETYNLLDRARAALLPVLRAAAARDGRLTAASLGGGPGFELHALREWVRGEAALESVHGSGAQRLVSLDLQGGWAPYAERLGLGFVGPWDLTKDDPVASCGLRPGELHVAIISYVLIYCCDEATAERIANMLRPPEQGGLGLRALIVSERSHVQPMIPMLEKRGVVTLRLMRQDSREGTDHRQLLFLPPGSSPAFDVVAANAAVTFENVPFMKGT